MIIKTPNVTFHEHNHTYSRNIDGYMYTGVTTILQVRAKDFLKFWATKCNYEYMLENWDHTKLYTKDEKEELLLAAKNAHARVTRKANDIGSKAHSWISDYIKHKIANGGLIRDQKKLKEDLPDEKEAKNAIRAFLKWEKDNDVEWIVSEQLVASDKHLFAGTLDALGNVNGKLTLIDFKTSSMISEDYYLQTAGYQIALEEMEVYPEQRMILRFEKLSEEDWKQKNKKLKGVSYKEFESVVVPTDLKFDKDTFLHCREIHRWNLMIENMKNNAKVVNN